MNQIVERIRRQNEQRNAVRYEAGELIIVAKPGVVYQLKTNDPDSLRRKRKGAEGRRFAQ